MMKRDATKSDAEREEEEAQRLVRKSPTKKPPRRDKERGRVEQKDRDTDTKDKDLSLNYKDIGGKVARLYLMAMEFATEEAWEAYKEKHPGADRKDHTIQEQDESAQEEEDASPEEAVEEEEPHEKQLQIRPEADEAVEELSETERSLMEELGQSVAPEEPKAPEDMTPEEKVDARAQKYRDSGATYDDLYDKAVSDNPDSIDSQAARQVMLEQKQPYPEGVQEMPEDFEGELSAETRQKLETHAKNWDVYDHDAGLADVSERMAQALREKDQNKAAYYEEIQKVYEGARGDLRNLPSLSDENVNITKLMPSKTALNKLDETAMVRQLNFDSPKLYQSALFSSKADVAKAIEDLDEVIEKQEEGSSAHKYYTELRGMMGEVLNKKSFDATTGYGQLLQTMEDAGKEGLDPSKVDFTDPDAVKGFVDNMRKLSDKELVDLVKDNPDYRMALDYDADTPSEGAVLSQAFRQRLFDYLTDDFLTQGYFEQLRMKPDEPGRARTFDPIQVKAFIIRRQQEQRATKTPENVSRDGFGAWMAQLLEALMDNEKKAHVRAASFARGMTRAYRASATHRARTAQYRGLPGPLPRKESPPAPEWRLPLGSMCLELEDYQLILREAKLWLTDSRLAYVRDMEGAQEDMLLCLALDYAIHTASQYKYAGMIDAPTYERLLGILRRIT